MDEYALAPRVWRDVKPNPVLDAAEEAIGSATNAIFGVRVARDSAVISPNAVLISPLWRSCRCFT